MKELKNETMTTADELIRNVEIARLKLLKRELFADMVVVMDSNYDPDCPWCEVEHVDRLIGLLTRFKEVLIRLEELGEKW